nr:MAG TPA: hypothetical protein [Caudoviricetes sp.]
MKATDCWRDRRWNYLEREQEGDWLLFAETRSAKCETRNAETRNAEMQIAR